MSRMILSAAFGVLFFISVVILGWKPQVQVPVIPENPNEASSEPQSTEETQVEVKLQQLLNETAQGDKKQESGFFQTLSNLAREKGWSYPAWGEEEGRAVTTRDGQTPCVV